MTQKKTYRMAQVNRLLQEEIAALLLTELQDENMLAITVTGVRASSDLHNAIVYITTHKGEDPTNLLEIVKTKAGYIRKLLYPRLHLKRIPMLDFRYDDTLDKAERIYRTLDQVLENESVLDDESNQPATEE